MKKRKPEPGVVACYASLSRARRAPDKAVEALRPLLDRDDLGPPRRREALFELGHALDALGEYAEAFDRFVEANALAKSEPDPGPRRSIEAWTADTIQKLPRPDLDASACVFVVGMPRSSTSLTEQVVCMHPEADGVGESVVLSQLGNRGSRAVLSDPGSPASARALHDIGRAYLSSVEPAMGEGVSRVLDKMPGNDVWLGLADRALPGARAIWCRRDPRDVVLSCYFQNFVGGIAFASDLEMCATRAADHDELMRHWAATLELPIHEHRYDAFVREPEPATRALLGSLGLGFDPACLRFYESKRRMDTASMSQVREPVFDRSLARWRNYESRLGPALEILESRGALADWDA